MKMIKNLVLVSALLAVSGVATAASKIAILDMEKALLATDVMQARVKELNKEPEFAALKAKYESLQADLKALVQEAQSNKMTWSDADKQSQRIKAEAKQAEMRLAAQNLNQQRQTAMAAVLKELGPKAETALKQITAAEDINLVLTRKAAVWASESTDITGKLTARINKSK